MAFLLSILQDEHDATSLNTHSVTIKAHVYYVPLFSTSRVVNNPGNDYLAVHDIEAIRAGQLKDRYLTIFYSFLVVLPSFGVPDYRSSDMGLLALLQLLLAQD